MSWLGGQDGWFIALRLLRLSRIYVAVVAHDGLLELTPLTIFKMHTMLQQLTLFTLLALTLCMNALFHYDCLGHQELENIAHDGLKSLMELELVGRMGQTVTTTRAPAELIIFYYRTRVRSLAMHVSNSLTN